MGSIAFVKSTHTSKAAEDSIHLISESFGKVDASSREYYEWQYLKNPLGQGTVLLAYDGQVPIGQFASIPCIYRINDDLIRTSLFLNLVVSPGYRRRGIMLKLLHEIRSIESPVPLSIGVPNAQSLRGKIKGGDQFHPLQMNLLVRPIRLSNYFNGILRSLLTPFDLLWKKSEKGKVHELVLPFDKKFDDLLNDSYKTNLIEQVRNAAYLNWRYGSNPTRKYQTFITLGQTGRLDGYIVLRVTKLKNIPTGVFMDFVFRDNNAGEALILKALNYLWQKNIAVALCACFPNNTESAFLTKYGFLRIPKRLYPHPLILSLKILSSSSQSYINLLDRTNWIFRFGDFDIF